MTSLLSVRYALIFIPIAQTVYTSKYNTLVYSMCFYEKKNRVVQYLSQKTPLIKKKHTRPNSTLIKSLYTRKKYGNDQATNQNLSVLLINSCMIICHEVSFPSFIKSLIEQLSTVEKPNSLQNGLASCFSSSNSAYTVH